MQGQIAYLVQKQRASGSHLELAGPVSAGIGESPLDMAEQLALEQTLGQRAHINADHGHTVYLPCQHVLAGAVLPGDEDAGIGTGDLLHYRAQLPHLGRVSPVHLPVTAYLVLNLAQLLDLLPAPAELQGGLKGGQQLCRKA